MVRHNAMAKIRLPAIGQLVQYATALALLLTVLTAVPLFISYLRGGEGVAILTDLHVWFGVAWIIVAVSNFVLFKRPLFQFRRYL
jgi:hypothetical protein